MRLLLFFILGLLPLGLHYSLAQISQEQGVKNCTLEFEMTGFIGPATLSLLKKGIGKAQEQNCSSILALINTPGGSLDSTREIVSEILNSPLPILCLVYPSGGHAGSAGAILMQACHVNGAMAATNLGAATPISSTGTEMPEDLRKKIMNDTRSWVEGLTQLRGRSKKFGQDIIMEAKAVTAEEALKLKAIDFVARKKMDFLNFAQGREVQMTEENKILVEVGDIYRMEPSMRDKLLALFTDPQIAYLLFMGSLALLYFEITHPGTLVAGVVGGVGLVISLIALNKLEVEWGGLVLLALGLGLLIAEAFVPSFGILGLGGIAAFVTGSLFLFDPEKTGGYQLPIALILTTAFTLGFIMMGLAYLAFKTFKLKPRGGGSELLGQWAKVVEVFSDGQSGQLDVEGETWRFESSSSVRLGEKVYIEKMQGLTLKVTPTKEIK